MTRLVIPWVLLIPYYQRTRMCSCVKRSTHQKPFNASLHSCHTCRSSNDSLQLSCMRQRHSKGFITTRCGHPRCESWRRSCMTRISTYKKVARKRHYHSYARVSALLRNYTVHWQLQARAQRKYRRKHHSMLLSWGKISANVFLLHQHGKLMRANCRITRRSYRAGYCSRPQRQSQMVPVGLPRRSTARRRRHSKHFCATRIYCNK